MAAKINKSDIKNLPEGAKIQGKYVFFRYSYSENGKQKFERDHIGTVDGDQFIPNGYYLREKPTKKNRTPQNWSNPAKRKEAMEKASQLAAPTEPIDVPEQNPATCVGVTAVMMHLTYNTGLVDDVLRIFKGDVAKTLQALNLSMKTAIATEHAYWSKIDPSVHRLIESGSLLPSQVSDFLSDIGTRYQLAKEFEKCHLSRFEGNQFIALDGVRVSDHPVGEAGAHNEQPEGDNSSALSFLIDPTAGTSLLSYRSLPGHATMKDFVQLWRAPS